MPKPRTFTDDQIASFMELKSMSVTAKEIAKEYGCEPDAVNRAVDNAKRLGMSAKSDKTFRERLHMPWLIGDKPRSPRGRTDYRVEGVE